MYMYWEERDSFIHFNFKDVNAPNFVKDIAVRKITNRETYIITLWIERNDSLSDSTIHSTRYEELPYDFKSREAALTVMKRFVEEAVDPQSKGVFYLDIVARDVEKKMEEK